MKEERCAEVLKAIAPPSRIKIIKVLEKGQKCVKELEELIGIKQSNLSQHLRILKDKGIIDCRRRGMEVCYRIKDRGILEIINCLENLFARGRGDDR